MIDIKDLRENPEKYRRGAELKNVTVNIPAVLDLDGQFLRASRNLTAFAPIRTNCPARSARRRVPRSANPSRQKPRR